MHFIIFERVLLSDTVLIILFIKQFININIKKFTLVNFWKSLSDESVYILK